MKTSRPHCKRIFWANKAACLFSYCCGHHLWVYHWGRLGRVEITILGQVKRRTLAKPFPAPFKSPQLLHAFRMQYYNDTRHSEIKDNNTICPKDSSLQIRSECMSSQGSIVPYRSVLKFLISSHFMTAIKRYFCSTVALTNIQASFILTKLI